MRYQNEALWVKSFTHSFVVTLQRKGVFAPNKNEEISLPAVIEMSDKIVDWIEVLEPDVEKLLTNPELVGIVDDTLKELYARNI